MNDWDGVTQPQWAKGLPKRVVNALLTEGFTSREEVMAQEHEGSLWAVRGIGALALKQIQEWLGVKPMSRLERDYLQSAKALLRRHGYTVIYPSAPLNEETKSQPSENGSA